MEVLDFAVSLPSSIVRGFDEPEMADHSSAVSSNSNRGIVGTITLFGVGKNSSAMIWFGWGHIIPEEEEKVAGRQNLDETAASSTAVVGESSNLSMGPLVVSMPRTDYRGAFSSDGGSGSASSGGSAATSKLVGCSDDEEEMTARQMSSRLSTRLRIPVFVSCSLDASTAPQMAIEGIDQGMVQQRAAALAEKEVYQILSRKMD